MREREEEAQKHKEEARREETIHLAEEGVAEKCARTDKSDRNGHTGWRIGWHILIALQASI